MGKKKIFKSQEIVYEYEFGRLKKEGKIIFECEYDKDGNVIKHTDYYMHIDKPVIQYSALYDKKGNDMQWDEFNEDGKFDNRLINKFDKKQ